MVAKFGIGQAVRRVEDVRFLKGAGNYVGDISLPGQTYGVVVYSTQAHARIRKVDTSAAEAAPGVLLVLTGADAIADQIGGLAPAAMPEDIGIPVKSYRTIRPVLVADEVRCVGDRVAFVVAETEAEARDAADLVEIDYETLPAVVTLEEAVKPGAPAVWADCPSNISYRVGFGDEAAVKAAFDGAKHVAAIKLVNNRVSANSMEARAAHGQYEPATGRYTLHTSTQDPFGIRQKLAMKTFHEPVSKFRVISPDVGGGFGMKGDCYPEDVLVLWASKRLDGAPVRWVSTRAEALMSDAHGRDQVISAELALDEGGKILALRSHALDSLGAYTAGAQMASVFFGLRLSTGVYDIGTIHAVADVVFTNTTPMVPYRGAGRPEAAYLIERLMDAAALKTGIDPVELRRRNFIKPEQMPYHTQTHYVYDSGEFDAALAKALELADWAGFAARKAESEAAGKARGRGLAYFIEEAGIFNERMDLRFDSDGNVAIIAGTHSHGQGHETAFAQMVHEWLGIPIESIRYVQGDTDKVSIGRGTYASRSVMNGGNALKVAADDVIAKGRKMAARILEATPETIDFADGLYKAQGTNKSVPLQDVAKAFFAPVGLPMDLGVGLEGHGSYASEPGNFPNGCHVCEVEIDPETGVVTPVRYTCIDDLGRVINPMIVEGQITGALAQGVGQALMEHVIYDKDSGQLVTGSFMDYAMPRASDMSAPLQIAFHNVPARTNPIGVKGIGEAGCTGSPPAIMNAVMDALRPLGVKELDMPATPFKVWQAIEAAKAARRVQ
ncbi:MAG TPA: xanthine dehydrogenase family protein molybdopterin-binding subunit [Hyphomicrobiaceae bacterium]|nr:xanthine dehydrogenase family protein molybdopterin-binding subunit [Hyphomicrobiaceae bacterium]